MKKALLILSAFLLLLLPSCGKESGSLTGSGSADGFVEEMKRINTLECPESLLDRFSYAYGNIFAASLEELGNEISPEYFVKGFLDTHGESFFTEKEIEDIFIEYQTLLITEAQKEFDDEKLRNREEADSFLRVNRMRTGVHVTDSGLQYERIRDNGTGVRPTEDSTVVMDYTMTLLNGSVVESSYDRASRAVVKVSDLPSGFMEALMMMGPSDKYRFWIPPELAFGDGTESIGPSELIIFEVTLHEVQ